MDTALYVLELPNLDYDKDQLTSVLTTIDQMHWVQWFYDKNKNKITTEHVTCELKNIDISPHPVVNHIISQFNTILGIDKSRMSFVKFPSIYTLPLHRDPIRQAAIILPIYPKNPAPIFWGDDSGKKVYDHVYQIPTVINTQEPHGVVNDGRVRMTMHIDLMLPWKQLRSLYESNEFLR